MGKEQEKRITNVRIELAKRGIRINELTEILRKKYPELKVTPPYVSRALAGKYDSFLSKIEKELGIK